MSFQIRALAADTGQHLFDLSDGQLRSKNARKVTVDAKPGYPCRITLRDAEIGEEMILMHYQHLDVASPYRAGHAILVGKGKRQSEPAVGEIPQALFDRPLSLRGFDRAHMLINSDLAEGEAVGNAIAEMFRNPDVAVIHLHNAKPGCYAACATRVFRDRREM